MTLSYYQQLVMQFRRSFAAGAYDVIFVSSIMETDDVLSELARIRVQCNSNTRIVIEWYAMHWEPMLRIAQKLGFRKKTALKNWLSRADIENFLVLARFEKVTAGEHILIPFYIPGISWLCNTFIAPLPIISKLCVGRWLVARPKGLLSLKNPSVSIVVPCRNERGNIARIIERVPAMGSFTELIFIEGHSRDNTFEEIERCIAHYSHKNIIALRQPGEGKGDAVRAGAAVATGDIFMILDADMTVEPEELSRFYEALVSGIGECINGSRLVYGMETGAMRFLNMLANYSFALGFSWLLKQRIKDTLCGTKVLWRSDYERVMAQKEYFGDFDPFGDFDVLFGAAKLHLKIIDLPIRYRARTYGTTQIRRFYHGLLLMRVFLFGIKFFIFDRAGARQNRKSLDTVRHNFYPARKISQKQQGHGA